MLEVRFNGYKCNTGCGDNGKYSCEEKFEEMDKSIEFIKHIINLIKKYKNYSEYSEKDSSFLEKYNIDFVVELIGLFEVETLERELHVHSFL